MKPRLIVLTDISSLTPGVREPDDGQSMIRLMLYANEFDMEALIAGSNMGHGQVCRPELIRQVVEAYGQVQPNLLRHSTAYPPAETLLERIHAGQPAAGPQTPLEDSIGPGKDTEASRQITAAIDREDPRPVWVAVWGGTTDLAQALWQARAQRSARKLADFVAKIRVHSIGDQDATGPWLKANFPELYYITNQWGFRGMYRGGDPRLVSAEWVEENVCGDHGALGALYPNYNGGDIWGRELGPVRGVKEGDTPSYLGLVPNGLNPDLMPTWGSWGGRWKPEESSSIRLTDAVDLTLPGTTNDPRPEMSATYRWREAFQNDFAARLDWCVQPPERANHAPRARVAPLPGDEEWHGAIRRRVAPGEFMTLDASASYDPDGGGLHHHWMLYPEPGGFHGPLPIEGANGPVAHLRAPGRPVGGSAHDPDSDRHGPAAPARLPPGGGARGGVKDVLGWFSS